MNDIHALSSDIDIFESLAEVSEEAANLLEHVRSLFYSKAVQIAQRDDIPLYGEYQPTPSFQSGAQKPTHFWRVVHVNEKTHERKVLAADFAYSQADAMSNLMRVVNAAGFEETTLRHSVYFGDDFYIYITVKELAHVKTNHANQV